MGRFFKFLFVAYFIMAISSQAFAGNLCCQKSSKNDNNNIEQTSNSKMPCHQTVDAENKNIAADQNNGETKSHNNCCCDMGNCMAKFYFKTPESHELSLEGINFPDQLTNYISQSVNSPKQPPKHSV